MDKLVALVRRVATDKVLLLALAALGYFLVLLVVYSYFKGLYFESIPVNGGFQHFNPIRRLWHGEIPGRDFIVFHGSGIPLLSLPIFAALGQNLFASEFSRYFLNGLFVFLGNFLFLSLFIRTRSSALLVSLLFTFVMSIGGYFWLLDPIGDAYSVLGIRTFFPLLALVVAKRLLDAQSLAGESTTMISSVRDVSVLGLFTAIAIFFGTEQGLAFCLAASAGIFFLYPVRGIARRFALAILQFASAAVSFVAIASVYSLGDPRPLLRHTFVDVPGDQIWFFGAPPSRMLTSLSDIYSTVADAIIMERMAIFSIALVGLVLMRRRFSRPELFVLWVAM